MIYRVRVESHNVETFTVRADSKEAACDEAENLVTGRNLSLSSTEILRTEEDEGQEVDND
jgi:hypothetical protein